MDWLEHPKFARARDRALALLSNNRYRFRRLAPVVFLCGGENSDRRDRLAEYLRRHHSNVSIFYAEAVWAVIVQQSTVENALAVEEKLAELADLVMIVVESPGTFAELGAFAISPSLRRKLLPILDIAHRDAESFIRTGPVRWIDEDSRFAPAIWSSPDAILRAGTEIDERVRRIPHQRPQAISNVPESPKHLVFFVCDLVAVFGPCTREHLQYFLDQIFAGTTVDLNLSIGLGCALKIIKAFRLEKQQFYFRPLRDGQLPGFQKKRRYIDIPTLRVEVLAAMQRCDICAPALVAMSGAL